LRAATTHGDPRHGVVVEREDRPRDRGREHEVIEVALLIPHEHEPALGGHALGSDHITVMPSSCSAARRGATRRDVDHAVVAQHGAHEARAEARQGSKACLHAAEIGARGRPPAGRRPRALGGPARSCARAEDAAHGLAPPR
jgi:hypothetical protein